MSETRRGREVRLASRPHGTPTPDNFALAEVDVPPPAAGQVVIRNLFMSVDPYMRGRMNDAKSYVAPFAVGEPMEGGAVGEVVESAADEIAVGDLVLHGLGWREYAVADARSCRRVERIDGVPLSAYLGVLGMPGFTAYVGLTEIAQFREGDSVFVSGAAGAVGSTAGQLARLKGASRVVGSAGTPEKVAWLTGKLGFDAAFDYHDGSVRDLLHGVAPDGIDVYFDNVGGEHLEAAIGALHTFGRVAACGAISQYNATSPPPGPRNIGLVVGKRLTIRGYIVSDHSKLMPQFLAEAGPWLREGKLTYRETVVDGIDHAADAFLGMLSGDNTGKMIVRLADA